MSHTYQANQKFNGVVVRNQPDSAKMRPNNFLVMNNNSRNDHEDFISGSIKNVEDQNNSRSPLMKQKAPRRRLLDNGNPKQKANNKDLPELQTTNFDEEGEEEGANNNHTPIEVAEDMEDDFFEANDQDLMDNNIQIMQDRRHTENRAQSDLQADAGNYGNYDDDDDDQQDLIDNEDDMDHSSADDNADDGKVEEHKSGSDAQTQATSNQMPDQTFD